MESKSNQEIPVLVAIMNNWRDFKIAKEQHWYRIPVKTAPKIVPEADYLAFYQTKVFGDEKWSVRYYSKIKEYQIVKRVELLPDEANHKRVHDDYYKITIEPLLKLPNPIRSRKGRRITFIPTTLEKLLFAEEINDLYDESPLEDKIWKALKSSRIEAVRQYLIHKYRLDFMIECRKGQIDIECNGDIWHSQKERIAKDNERDKYLTTLGWRVLRFSSQEINENLDNCINIIKENINRLEGLITANGKYRGYIPEDDDRQMFLFDDS